MEKPLNPQQIAVYLAQVDNWKVIDNRKIQKIFEFKDFKEAMKFLNNVAKIAEKEQYHPDIYFIGLIWNYTLMLLMDFLKTIL